MADIVPTLCTLNLPNVLIFSSFFFPNERSAIADLIKTSVISQNTKIQFSLRNSNDGTNN